MHSYRSIVIATSGALFAAHLTLVAAAQIISVSQQRNVTADSIVSTPGQQDFESINAPDFGEFIARATSEIANASAQADTVATQHSTIDPCSVSASGNAFAHGDTSEAGFHGYSIGVSSCQVIFDITQPTEFLIAGTIHGGVNGQARVTLQTITSQLVFTRMSQGTPLDVHHRVTLAPGRYSIIHQGLATVAANDGAAMTETVSFDLTLTRCFIPADINVDGTVGVPDLLGVINGWGACPAQPLPCAADVDLNGSVGVADLLAVINAWGQST
jgi:hypothetical protein